MPRRVVITGLGAVSALGLGALPLWDALCAGTANLSRISRFDPSSFRTRLGGQVPDFAIRDYVPKHYRKATKVMARDIELAVAAAKLAVDDARLVTRGTLEEDATEPTTYPSARMGCHIGAGLIAADSEEMAAAMATSRAESGAFSLRKWGGQSSDGATGGMDALTPLWLLKYLPNMLACHVTIIHGAEGPSNTITCGEASGLLSIGESTRVITRGAADLCFSGGAESKINPMGLLRLDLAGWLAGTNEQTEGTFLVRPFEKSAPGSIVGEGGGILILEEFESARARNIPMYAEIVGFGGGHSDHNYPDAENDEGFRSAIENALDDARIKPDQVSAIVPLAAGVPVMDRAEAGALRAVFGSRIASIPLITCIPNLGLTMAGTGGLQAAIAALAIKHQKLPARLHAGSPESGMLAGPTAARPANLDYVLACTGSLGAQNAAIVFKAIR